jgi:uncharacterized protein YecE (DUF72 family)
MEEPTIHIGCAGPGCPRLKYSEALDLSEVSDTFRAPPTEKVLTRWKRSVPDDFIFTLRAWQIITHEPGPKGYPSLKGEQPQVGQTGHFRETETVRNAFERMADSAEAIGAKAIVFDTPSSFTPTKRNQQRLDAFFSGIERPADVAMVWRPAGVWTGEQVAAICQSQNLVWAVDPVSDSDAEQYLPHGGIAYFTLRRPHYLDDDYAFLISLAQRYEATFAVFDNLNSYSQAVAMRGLL